MTTYTTMKGFGNVGDPTLGEIVEENLVTFINWGFVDKGAYFNIRMSSSGTYGGDQSRLKLVRDPRYSNGQVWEAFRQNWVWESGASQPEQPIQVSGVYVNGVFRPLASGGFHVNYPLGRVVFDSALPANSLVQAEYSPRWITAYAANNVPVLKEAQFRSFRVDDSTFLYAQSGSWTQLGDARIQLPAVVVETTDTTYKPYQIGGNQYAFTDVIFHVLAEDGKTAEKIADQISFQNEKTIFLYDVGRVVSSGRYPLTFTGSIASGALTFPDLVRLNEEGGFRWRKLRFSEANKQRGITINQNLYHRPVRMTTEVVLTDI